LVKRLNFINNFLGIIADSNTSRIAGSNYFMTILFPKSFVKL
jgi:hypothetical protein